jgi:hypothetical protein
LTNGWRSTSRLLETFLASIALSSVRAANYWLGLEHPNDAEVLAPPTVWDARTAWVRQLRMQRVAWTDTISAIVPTIGASMR